MRSLSVEPGFVLFFMQADLFSKMCKKKKKFILKTINIKWDIVSFFSISAGAQSGKLSRLYLSYIYFGCLLFLFFHCVWFLFRFFLCHATCMFWQLVPAMTTANGDFTI